MKSFFKETCPPLHSSSSESWNGLASQNWLRRHESLLWWFKLDCYSLNLKPFHLYKSSKNLIDCLLFLFQGHHNQLANIRGSRWSDYSDHCSNSTVHHGNCAQLDWQLSCATCTLPPWDLIPISLRNQSLVASSSSQGNFWPSEKSNHRALQEGWGCPHKFISHTWWKDCPKVDEQV